MLLLEFTKINNLNTYKLMFNRTERIIMNIYWKAHNNIKICLEMNSELYSTWYMVNKYI